MRLAALALQDLVLLVYLSTVALLLRWRAPAPGSGMLFWRLVGGVVVLASIAVAARTCRPIPRRIRLGVYRVVLVASIVWAYLELHDVLPMVRPDAVDGCLAAADTRLCGGDLALWLERYNCPFVVEWLSFFYFNYFTLNLAYVIVVLWLEDLRHGAAEYGLGTVLVYALGHLGYMAVPAYGPIVFFADRFREPLHGGLFLRLVLRSVEVGGANKDAFPSLHTAASAWLSLYALRRARLDCRWRWSAAVTCFFAANIVVSTLVLRWHYLVDVLAGLVLAAGAAWAAARLAPWEEAWRRRHGLPPVWTFE